MFLCALCVWALCALCVCKCFVFGINHVQKYLYNPTPFVAPPPGRHVAKLEKKTSTLSTRRTGVGWRHLRRQSGTVCVSLLHCRKTLNELKCSPPPPPYVSAITMHLFVQLFSIHSFRNSGNFLIHCVPPHSHSHLLFNVIVGINSGSIDMSGDERLTSKIVVTEYLEKCRPVGLTECASDIHWPEHFCECEWVPFKRVSVVKGEPQSWKNYNF